MKITFLGTGASEGVPALFCNCKLCRESREQRVFHTRSQLLIGDNLLIDFPPDTYHRALTTGINLSKIENILITHSHSDHFYSEDFFMRGLLSSFKLPTETVLLHGNTAVRDMFEKNGCARQFGSYENKVKYKFNGYNVYDQSSEYIVHTAFETFTVGKYTVTALPSIHIDSEQCLIYLVTDGKKTVLYGTDTAYFSQEVISYLENNKIFLDALIVDGTYGLVDCHEGHMNFFDNDKLRRELLDKGVINQKTRCFITHVFHGAARNLELLKKAVPNGFTLPTDGSIYEI